MGRRFLLQLLLTLECYRHKFSDAQMSVALIEFTSGLDIEQVAAFYKKEINEYRMWCYKNALLYGESIQSVTESISLAIR